MKSRKTLVNCFIGTVLVLAAIWLMPDPENLQSLKTIVMIVLAVAAVVLLYLITKRRDIAEGVRILKVESASQMNPSQYLSKGGPVCAGSDGRYEVTFLLKNEQQRVLSLSAKQAGPLVKGMRGTLCYNDRVFVSFTPEKS